MAKKIRWGVLGTANIAVTKVIPGMRKSALCEIAAIASRDLRKAQDAATAQGIPKAYGSYEDLLADPEIDAIYNPLPNHLHVPWTTKAAEAGKHVLCEKPIGLTAAEAETLIAVRERTGVKISEAFMVLCHPQWVRLRELLRAGAIGELRVVQGCFSYYNVDPANVRNIAEIGGGGLLDIGCYMVLAGRYAFEREPLRVVASVDRDPVTKTDRLASAMMEFGGSNGATNQAVFTCSTQLVPYQRLEFLGTTGRIELEVPVNAAPELAARLNIDTGVDLYGGGMTTETFPVCDQYGLEGDAFSRAILENAEVPVPLEAAVKNMAVMDAIFRSERSGMWEPV
ncbi:MAG TPA: Gfo/Idh/MocA family oxidoreductase [Acidobacteriaceae bacterium]